MARQHVDMQRPLVWVWVLTIGLAPTVQPAAGQVRMYEVQFTDNPPTIDGIVDPGEWDSAPVKGDFSLLREDPSLPDAQNTRFQALWDRDNFYLLLQTETLGFTPRPAEDNPGPDLGGIVENWNLYWDPNLDGDPNLPDPPPASGFHHANDSYQLSFGQHLGTSVMQGDSQDGNFVFNEAHVNTRFGNQANWRPGLGEIVIAQVNEPGFGTAELVIPWTEFNADAEIPDGMGGTIQTGLHHPFAPSVGDVWFFQASRISTDRSNFLPIWNWTPSQTFASHPHGELIFVPEPATVVLIGLAAAAGLALRRRVACEQEREEGDSAELCPLFPYSHVPRPSSFRANVASMRQVTYTERSGRTY
jgi:hypothetical protein